MSYQATMAVAEMDLRLRTLATQMAGAEERKVLRKMFPYLRHMPHLWKKQRNDDKEKTKADMLLLTKIYRQFDHYATVCTVKRKLDALIRSYVKEKQRIIYARRTHPHDLYQQKPRLWHYKEFKFLDTVIEFSALGWLKYTLGSQVFQKKKCKVTQTATFEFNGSPDMLKKSTKDSSQVTPGILEPEEVPESVYFRRSDSAVYEPNKAHGGKNKNAVERFVDAELKGADEKQMKIAAKLITDTLVNAMLKKLTDDSRIELGEDTVEKGFGETISNQAEELTKNDADHIKQDLADRTILNQADVIPTKEDADHEKQGSPEQTTFNVVMDNSDVNVKQDNNGETKILLK